MRWDVSNAVSSAAGEQSVQGTCHGLFRKGILPAALTGATALQRSRRSRAEFYRFLSAFALMPVFFPISLLTETKKLSVGLYVLN